MVCSFNFCLITPKIWGAQKNMDSIGESEKKSVTEKRIAQWNIVNHFLTDN